MTTDKLKWPSGPWAVDPDDAPGCSWNNHVVQQADRDKRICFMAHKSPDNTELVAAAHLIAAAPELYDALARAAQSIDIMSKGFEEVEIDGAMIKSFDLVQELEGAIAKARGETP